MKIAFRLAFLVIAIVLGYWLWTIFFPSPEKVVLKKISSLAATATFSSDESNLARAAKAGNLAGFFAPDARVNIGGTGYPERTLSGRDEIRETALAGFASLPALKVRFLDATVQISADKLTADVDCTASVNVGNSKDSSVQEMHFRFQKTNGNWLITLVATVKTLS